jgi:hypothetical protein
VLGQVHLLDAAIPIPANGRQRPIQSFHRSPLGIAKIELTIDEAPLDTITFRQIAIFRVEHVDVPRPGSLRIPAYCSAILVNQPHDLTTIGLPSQAHHAIVGMPCNTQTSDLAVEAEHLPCPIEASHMLLDIGHSRRRKDGKATVLGGQSALAFERLTDLTVDDQPRCIVKDEDIGAGSRSGLSLIRALTTCSAIFSLSVTVLTLSSRQEPRQNSLPVPA